MLGIWSPHYQQYLLVFSISTAFLFSIPLFLAPLHWARLMLWNIPHDTDLTVYFGRCLGALALVINLIIILAAVKGEGIDIIFHGLNLLMSLMVGLHIYGAIKGIQPITETVEIGFWFALLLVNLCFQPVG